VRLCGFSLIRGMSITIGHFFNTYVQGLKRIVGMAKNGKHGPGASGIFTVQYPEERMPVAERFRVLPMLVYDEATGNLRCTACGICTKVCPTQCIWIVQAKGEDGKPKNKPESFVIDVNVCMNCGLCEEFCPFDSIKMDQRFELATYTRKEAEASDLQDLLVSSEYHRKIHPEGWAVEEAKRAKKAAPKPVAPKPAAPAVEPPKETPPAV